ncbi:MAG: ABC transporter ATP-binding protein, partial [Shewanella sp.]
IRELVRSLSPTTTFVISSHNLDELEKLCDQVLYLDKGELGQSISMHSSNRGNDYFTLTMQNCDSELLIKAVAHIAGVVNITSKQPNVFVIQLADTANHNYEFETALLTLFKQHHWQYKMLQKGRTLEETLFS